MHIIKHLIFFALFLIPSLAISQELVKGRVVDAETNEMLAFANVAVPETEQGTTTDIDGKFSLKVPAEVDTIVVSYVGYKKKYIPLRKDKNNYRINLKTVDFELSGVTVKPGKNPAHRIIKNAIKRREENNPESKGAFKLKTYNKLVAKPHEDYLRIDTSEADSAVKKLRSMFSDKNLFIMETVSQRFFEAPDKIKEEVLHTQVSGLKTPFFFLLGSQLQSFTFYEDLIRIGGSRLVNPISKGSTDKYWFRIEDTTYVQDPQDTVFTISFRKRRDRSFNGMEGVLQIGSRDFAIRSVNASPVNYELSDPQKQKDSSGVKEEKNNTSEKENEFRIQQKYEKIQGKKWFPVQLNTDITLHNFQLKGGIPVKLEGRTYIKDVELPNDIENSVFDENYMEMDREAAVRNDSMISIYRKDSLTQKNRTTYAYVDSVGEKANLEKKIKTYRILSNGYIPWGPVNIPINEIVNYNVYEGWRLGLKLTTNNKFSNVLRPSVYGAWAIKDHRWKYGANLDWKIYDEYDLFLKLRYHNDVREMGALPEFDDKGLLDSYELRGLLVNRMDNEELSEFSFKFRTLKYAELETGYRQRYLEFNNDYRFGAENNGSSIGIESFKTSELFVKLRYAFRERYIKTPFGKNSLATKYPVFWLNYTRGMDFTDGQLQYEKYNMQIQKDFHTKYLGSTSLLLRGGLVSNDITLSLQYTAFGSYYPFTIACPGTFNTMRFNEYAANQYVSFYFSHDFKKHLFRTQNFKPSVSLNTSAIWGKWSNEKIHKNVEYKSFENGYFESGVLIRNLLKGSFAGLGVGLYYRWGPESLNSFKKNLAIKFVIGID